MYARVDLIYDNENNLSLSEIELIDPELWFRLKNGSADLLSEKIMLDYKGNDFKNFKQDLCDLLVSKISKISTEMKKLLSDYSYLNSILSDGAKEAEELSKKNMSEIKKIIKFYTQ